MTGRPARDRASSKIWLVARREVRSRLRSRAMKISTAIFVIVILLIGIVNRAISDSSTPRTRVVTVGAVPSGFADAVQQAGASIGRTITWEEPLADRSAADAALRDGKVDVVVDGDAHQMLFTTAVNETNAAVVGAAWRAASAAQAARQLGLTPAQIESIVSPPPLSATTVETRPDNDVGRLVGTLSAILLFLSLNTFGAMVLTGVVEEKTSAVVEILLAQVKAHVLLAGKVLGIGIVAMIQFALLVIAGVVSLKISGTSVPSEVWVALPSTLGWFLGGFAFYSTLFALAGSFVSRQEDAQASAAPISLMFTGGYIVVFVVAANPGSTLPTVLSILPPFAPLLMPLRIATGVATAWQVALAAVLLVTAVDVVIRVAGAIYARSLLHRGSRITWSQALRRGEPA
ncbi:MAG: ABC-type Na+ efflux pump permease component-like protein [Ilumatobacteraceae bacterium]|nr:ABC-type Na+ efflux pump permease component-like protein [Ilumatobacteraceae bacterium]